jgi:hypothetical protein
MNCDRSSRTGFRSFANLSERFPNSSRKCRQLGTLTFGALHPRGKSFIAQHKVLARAPRFAGLNLSAAVSSSILVPLQWRCLS